MKTEVDAAAESIRSVAKHSAVYTTAEFLKKGVGFLMIPLYTHYLAPADYGLIEVLTLMLDILGMLMGARMIAANTRYYHIYEQHVDKREVYTTSLIFALFTSSLGIVLLWGASGTLARLTLGSADYAPHYHLIIVCLAIQNIYLLGENDLIIRKQSILFSSFSIGLMILSLSLNIIFLVVFHLGVWAILWSIFITKIANCGVLPITLRGDRMRFSWDKLKKMLEYGLPLVPASLAMFAMHYSDRFFIQHYCSLTEVGIYSLGYKFGMILAVLITEPFSRSWGTHSFEIARRPEARRVYARMFTYFSCLLIAIGLGISVFIDDAIGVIAPPNYARAAAIVPWVVLAYIFAGLSSFVGLGIMLSFNTKYMAFIDVSLAVLNIVMNFFLIRPFGVMGAAFSTLFTFGIRFACTLLISQKLYPIPFEYRRLSIAAGVAISLFAVSRLSTGYALIPIALHCAALLAFPAILFGLKFFTDDELEVARKNFNRILPWLARPAA